MTPDSRHFDELDVFAALSPDERERLAGCFAVQTVQGGERLLNKGDAADDLHIVVSGRFAVSQDGGATLATIGTGEPVGEIGFFTGGVRTADVAAIRDSEVLTISRAAFDALADEHPMLWRSVVFALAERLERMTGGERVAGDAPPPRTLLICRAGSAPLAPDFIPGIAKAIEACGVRVRAVDAVAARNAIGEADADSPEMNRWLAAQEAAHGLLIYEASAEPDAWSRKAVRQADAAILICAGDPGQTTPVERMVFDRLAADNIRLAVVDGKPSDWLRDRPSGAWHRMSAIGADTLARFITGRARGLVLGGGGALCGAHVGTVFALREAGIGFDCFGGTSAGAAIAGALASGLSRVEIVERCKDIFLTNRSLKKWTVPRYGLLDPSMTDRMIKHHFGLGRVEDTRSPFFAIASDLADNKMHVMDRGPLWEAIRATCSIPVLLPPLIDGEGRILVDGGIMDNLPVDPMRAKKRGPNAAIVLGPDTWQRAAFKYADYPNRRQLLAEKAMPWKKPSVVGAPRAGQVLTRTMLLSSDAEAQRALSCADLVFQPPLPEGMSIMDWHRFEVHEQECYDWARAEVERRLNADPTAFDAFR